MKKKPKPRSRKGSERRGRDTQGDIQDGVGVAYAVIDDYIKEGRRVAEKIMPSPEAAGNFARELPQVTERMFRYASDFASVWLEAMGMVAAGAARQTSAPSDDPSTAGPWSAPVDLSRPAARSIKGDLTAPRVRIVINAAKEVSVSFQLAPGVSQSVLEAKGTINKSSARKARDLEVSASVFPGMVEVRVSVPKTVAAGSYAGELCAIRGKQAIGTFTVDVMA